MIVPAQNQFNNAPPIQNIFLACPTFNGLIDYRTARSIYQTASQHHKIMIMSMQNSLLAHGFNQMYAYALNNREKYDLKWFAMLHADIVPDPWWLDTLIKEAIENNADLLSAVVPLKDTRGLTSTAMTLPHRSFGCMMRLSLTQINALPNTFDRESIWKYLDDSVLPELTAFTAVWSCPDLLVNTGCMVLRLDRPWSDKIFFKIQDRIIKKDDTYYAEVEPEDWYLSRKVNEFGGKVMATSAVKVKHIGSASFDTHTVWGERLDPEFVKLSSKS